MSMNIFDYAMKMEKDGEKYYHDLADKCQIPGLKKILTMLAEDEANHYEIFKNLKENTVLKNAGSTVIKDAKNVFEEMTGTTQFNLEGTEVDMYKIAIEVEKKSEDFYREKAKEVDSEDTKNLLNKIAEEERNHGFLLMNMVDFLSRPETWIENAEFNRLNDY